MRVFYEEFDEISKPLRRYYIKVDNVSVPDELRGYKAIEASSIEELKKNIYNYYKFNNITLNNIELWSNQGYSGTRLDTMKEIPKEIDCLWVRIVLNRV